MVLLSIKVLAQQPTDLTYAATQVVNEGGGWVDYSSVSGKEKLLLPAACVKSNKVLNLAGFTEARIRNAAFPHVKRLNNDGLDAGNIAAVLAANAKDATGAEPKLRLKLEALLADVDDTCTLRFTRLKGRVYAPRNGGGDKATSFSIRSGANVGEKKCDGVPTRNSMLQVIGPDGTKCVNSGLHFNSIDGSIGGTPLLPCLDSNGACTWTITATNTGGGTSIQVHIRVHPQKPLKFTYRNKFPRYVLNELLTPNEPVLVQGDVIRTYTEVAACLPSGIRLHATTGILTGTPTTLSNVGTECEIRAENDCHETDGCSIPTKIRIAVVDEAPIVTGYKGCNGPVSDQVKFVKGENVVETVCKPVCSGGTPTSYTIFPPLPEGLIFNPAAGYIHGTPQTATDGSVAHLVTAKVSDKEFVTEPSFLLLSVTVTDPDLLTDDKFAYKCKEMCLGILNTAVSGTPVKFEAEKGPLPSHFAYPYSVPPTTGLYPGLHLNFVTGGIFGKPVFQREGWADTQTITSMEYRNRRVADTCKNSVDKTGACDKTPLSYAVYDTFPQPFNYEARPGVTGDNLLIVPVGWPIPRLQPLRMVGSCSTTPPLTLVDFDCGNSSSNGFATKFKKSERMLVGIGKPSWMKLDTTTGYLTGTPTEPTLMRSTVTVSGTNEGRHVDGGTFIEQLTESTVRVEVTAKRRLRVYAGVKRGQTSRRRSMVAVSGGFAFPDHTDQNMGGRLEVEVVVGKAMDNLAPLFMVDPSDAALGSSYKGGEMDITTAPSQLVTFGQTKVGGLPTNVNIDVNTGIISGTPKYDPTYSGWTNNIAHHDCEVEAIRVSDSNNPTTVKMRLILRRLMVKVVVVGLEGVTVDGSSLSVTLGHQNGNITTVERTTDGPFTFPTYLAFDETYVNRWPYPVV